MDRPSEESADLGAVLVGAYVRTADGGTAAVRAALSALERVEVFDIDGVDAERDGMLGVLVEAESLDEAHDRVTRDVRRCEGVLGVWPICVDLDGAPAADAPLAGATRHEGATR